MNEQQTFEEIRHTDADGAEYWLARELQVALGYAQWRRFEDTIDRAKISCEISKNVVADHFAKVGKMVEIGSGAKRNQADYKLTRYACYLIVMNGDPRKEVIAQGQTYFAVKTRQQELSELYAVLTEDERRLFLRSDVKQKNMLLAAAAQRAGIVTQYEYAAFNDAGYKGLYNGETAKDIAAHKGLGEKEEILDYMGGTELAANLFRITQTEERMNREKIDNRKDANTAHYEIGQIVRGAIKQAGGTMPEELPTPEKSAKDIEAAKRKEIKE